ncbi:MAG: HAD-IIA family hydrolase [Actinomycetota bacterium]|nr:HAD-IIA family hydrolase [Actinomycetota bacterium]
MPPGRVDGLVCDLDGVLYVGNGAVLGAPEALAAIRRAGVRIVLATNNATLTPEGYASKLREMGFAVDPAEILTSARVTAEVLHRRGMAGQRAYVIGADGLRDALLGVDVEPLPLERATEADMVVVGADPSFTYASLRAAADLARGGAPLIATNPDPTYPSAHGLLPGAGSLVAAIETASGAVAEVMGKPNRPMMEAAARRLEGCRSVAAIGDQPLTDLAGARSMGWRTILVLSGVTDASAAASLSPAADHVLADITELPNLL